MSDSVCHSLYYTQILATDIVHFHIASSIIKIIVDVEFSIHLWQFHAPMTSFTYPCLWVCQRIVWSWICKHTRAVDVLHLLLLLNVSLKEQAGPRPKKHTRSFPLLTRTEAIQCWSPGEYDTYIHQKYNATPSWSSWTTVEAQFVLGQRPVNTRIGTH